MNRLAITVGAVSAVVDGLGGGRVHLRVVVDVCVGFDHRASDPVVLQRQRQDFVGQILIARGAVCAAVN